MTSILVKRVLYVAWKLLPMARNNIMDPVRFSGLRKWIISHVNTFCKISNDLHGLMALHRHSGAPNCTKISSKNQMDPTTVFLVVNNPQWNNKIMF